jgi:hypothetical protein
VLAAYVKVSLKIEELSIRHSPPKPTYESSFTLRADKLTDASPESVSDPAKEEPSDIS